MTTLRNITVDRASSSSLDFSFQPAVCGDLGWRTPGSSQVGVTGTYRNCSAGDSSSGPSARLNFTGVAIFYLSPYLNESIQLTLDGVFMTEIDLTPKNSSNSSSVNTFWKALNLPNGEHVLDVRPGAKSKSLNLGTVIFTQLASNATTAPGTSDGSGLPNPSSIQPVGATAKQAGPPSDKFAIAFGSAFGAITLIVLFTIAFVLGRRRREWQSRHGRKTPVPPIYSLRGQGATAPGLETQASQEHIYPPLVYVTTDKINEATPPRSPLPSVAHGSFTTYDFDRERGERDGTYRTSGPSTDSSPNIPPSQVPDYVRSQVSRDTMSTTTTTKLEPVRRPTPQY